jgi:hypothetical protein
MRIWRVYFSMAFLLLCFHTKKRRMSADGGS